MSRLQDLLRTTEIDPEARNRFLLVAGMVGIVAFALGLRARRPLTASPGEGTSDQELLWDQRLLGSIGRAVRRLTGRI